MKVSELTDAALDWAVAICELKQHLRSLGKTPNYEQCDPVALSKTRLGVKYSTNWAQGGPIIEREDISLAGKDSLHNCWAATNWSFTLMTKFGNYKCDGETPLIAAMRCYVASKLGDETEIPEELL